MWLTISNWSKHSEAFEAIYSSIGHLHNGNTQTVWEELNWVGIFTHQTCLYRFSLYLHRDCFLVKGIVIVCWLQRNRHKKSTFRLLWRLLPWSFLWLFNFLWNFVSMSQHIGIGWRLIHRNFIYSLWIWETRWVAVKIFFIFILKSAKVKSLRTVRAIFLWVQPETLHSKLFQSPLSLPFWQSLSMRSTIQPSQSSKWVNIQDVIIGVIS